MIVTYSKYMKTKMSENAIEDKWQNPKLKGQGHKLTKLTLNYWTKYNILSNNTHHVTYFYAPFSKEEGIINCCSPSVLCLALTQEQKVT